MATGNWQQLTWLKLAGPVPQRLSQRPPPLR
jgi:hypothetical protein